MEKLNGKGEIIMRTGICKTILEDMLGICIERERERERERDHKLHVESQYSTQESFQISEMYGQ